MNLETPLDAYRKGWRRTREALHLVDPRADDFGQGGLARHAPEVTVRFLIQPADPALAALDFDESVWEWLKRVRPNPFEGAAPTQWGHETTPEVDAAVRYNRQRQDRWVWADYLALLRNGGFEFGLGRVGGGIWRCQGQGDDDGFRFFRLVTVVGRVWTALAWYADALGQFEIDGPWEISLALVSSLGAVLANVAAGWAEPDQLFQDELIRCPDPGVLIVREVSTWPDDDGLRALAFSVGGNIEDAFGMPSRRFLSRIEPGVGEFDASRYASG